MRMKWISDNPIKSLHRPKVKRDPTLPFTTEEVNAIVSACDRFPIKGIYGEDNRNRLRTWCYSSVTPVFASATPPTLRRERIRDGKLLLYMQKTGVPVFGPLPLYVIAALDETPNDVDRLTTTMRLRQTIVEGQLAGFNPRRIISGWLWMGGFSAPRFRLSA